MGVTDVKAHVSIPTSCLTFPQDLKRVLKKAGLDGKEVVFLFNDTQIMQEGYLEDLNNILNAGASCKRVAADCCWMSTPVLQSRRRAGAPMRRLA